MYCVCVCVCLCRLEAGSTNNDLERGSQVKSNSNSDCDVDSDVNVKRLAMKRNWHAATLAKAAQKRRMRRRVFGLLLNVLRLTCAGVKRAFVTLPLLLALIHLLAGSHCLAVACAVCLCACVCVCALTKY